MRYYCKYCKSTIVLGKGIKHIKDVEFACCVCETGVLVPFPDYETLEQYKKRTGKKWPENGAVFYFVKGRTKGWVAMSLKNARWATKNEQSRDVKIVCAQSPEPPTDEWRPA